MSKPNGKSRSFNLPGWFRHGRVLVQLLIVGLMGWTGYQMVTGVRGATIEKYCPFGGIETLFPWLNKTGTLCSLSTLNISMFFGVLAITLLAKRTFCSHICPVGAISEWITLLSGKLGYRWRVPGKVDKALKWLKYPLLIVILYFTAKVGELIFREFDPFYILFTGGQGHGIDEGLLGISAYSLAVIIVLFLLNALVPMLFCRYLCPMAACLNPVSRIGVARIHRNADRCIDCGKCDQACVWGVEVATVDSVKSAECTNCLDCVRACPVPDTLELRVGGGKR